ncbi:hypothetical protein C5167_011869 [Papaver somniferum]|uniref:Uncharacterized protein n=1 Tax=Papaver somniferum TaxID=3469 RepID=A0A4Y7IZU3_PAPSO|nr:uncharacterized protein LOC113355129 isoform X1 [Papaver somniferum]RZC53019.1 hypothetical protein C5167_011869 [Papaver somniferum]
MARIIKKAASSLTPVLLAYPRTAHRSSSIFITPQLKNSRNTISRSSSLIYRQDVLFRTTTRHFSSSIGKKRPPESDKIISAGEEAEKDLLKKVVETPIEFPFKIEDKPGEQTVILTREYMGNYIKVFVHMPDFSTDVNKEENSDESDNQNDQDKDSVNDPQSSIRLVVTNTNYLGTTLVYGVIAYPDGFSIDSFCIKYAYAPDEENIYYKGLDYAKLDNDLQKEYQRRLKIIGITPGTTNFLHEYMANRDMYSSDSSNSPPPTTTTTTTTIDQITPESLLTTFLNDEGIPANPAIEQYRQRGHPLVSAEEIRNSGKHPKDFIWIPYPYHRSEKLLWIEVPSKGHYATESEIEEYCIEAFGGEDFLDGEAYEANPYRCLPRKALGDPPVISEEMDKILYPDLKHANDPKKGCNVALRPYFDEMNKIKYHPDRDPDVVIFACDINREVY